MKKLMFVLGFILILGCSARKDIFSQRYSGTLELTEHVLGAKVAGRVMTLVVQEGDLVQAGQVIATLDRYDQAKKDYERLQELLKTGGANAQAVEYAQLAMQDQQIVSPIDGVVLVKSAQVGEMLASGAGVVVIGDIKEQWVKIFLPEGLVGQIQLGQKASIRFDGLDKVYEGRLSFLATKAEFTPRNVQTSEERITQVFAVKVMLEKPDEHTHPGVTADVEFK